MANRIFVAVKFARAFLTNQNHVWAAFDIVRVDVASGQQWNAPGLEKARHDIVRRRGGAFIEWRNSSFGTSVKNSATASEWDIAADAYIFKTRNGL